MDERIAVQKLGYSMVVNVVDGVPQCPTHAEPMIERDEGWMCPIHAAVLDFLAARMPDFDAMVLRPPDGTDQVMPR